MAQTEDGKKWIRVPEYTRHTKHGAVTVKAHARSTPTTATGPATVTATPDKPAPRKKSSR